MAKHQRVIFLAHTANAMLDGVKVDLYEGEKDALVHLTAQGWRVVSISAGENATGASGVFALIEKDG